MDCFQCGKALLPDEIAVYRRMVNRAAERCLCACCFAKEFGVDESLVWEKVRQFKKMGCTLFSRTEC